MFIPLADDANWRPSIYTGGGYLHQLPQEGYRIMRMKQVQTLALLVFCLASQRVIADPGKKTGHPGQHTQDDATGVHIIIRTESDKQQRKAKGTADRGPPQDNGSNNSNRQSDPDSVTGLERAQERRAQQAETHAQSGGKDDAGWYEYLFGKKQTAGEESERDWYGYLFGKPKAKKDDTRQDQDTQEDGNERGDSRWWPFD
jgi:hypothetical protein